MANVVLLSGRIVFDLELKENKNNKPFISNNLAVNTGTTTDFIPFTVFGKNAVNMANYCVKGQVVELVGHLYKDKKKDSQLLLTADTVYYGPKPSPKSKEPEIDKIESIKTDEVKWD